MAVPWLRLQDILLRVRCPPEGLRVQRELMEVVSLAQWRALGAPFALAELCVREEFSTLLDLAQCFGPVEDLLMGVGPQPEEVLDATAAFYKLAVGSRLGAIGAMAGVAVASGSSDPWQGLRT